MICAAEANKNSLLVNCGDYSSCYAMIAELTWVDALPCAEVETAIGDRDSYADAKKRTLGMSRHVVSALHGVIVVWLPLFDYVVKNLLHVQSYIRICVLVNFERA